MIRNTCTLPDYFSGTGVSPYDKGSIWQSSNSEKWTTCLEADLQDHTKKTTVWNNLRRTTKYIAKQDQTEILNLNASIDNALLQSVLKGIRQRTTQQTHEGAEEDSGHESSESESDS
jgi:hypothetical protein